MDNFKNLILVILICAALSVLYFNIALDPASIDKLFLTISTFLFSIFSGFFISRQAARYSDIRKSLAAIDGNMSAMYRASGHLGADFQSKVGGVIKEYYELILKTSPGIIILRIKPPRLFLYTRFLRSALVKTRSPLLKDQLLAELPRRSEISKWSEKILLHFTKSESRFFNGRRYIFWRRFCL